MTSSTEKEPTTSTSAAGAGKDLTWTPELRLTLLSTAYVHAEQNGGKFLTYGELAEVMGGKWTKAAINKQMTCLKKLAVLGEGEGVKKSKEGDGEAGKKGGKRGKKAKSEGGGEEGKGRKRKRGCVKEEVKGEDADVADLE